MLAAARRFLRPIVRLLLGSGISWREFVEVAKLVYVEVAREDYGLKGRPTNLSRVALITGMSRREVGRIRDQLSCEPEEIVEPHGRISQILTGWHEDPDFIDGNGAPRVLSAESFAELLRRFAGDIPSSAVAKEMKAVNLVEETDDGRFRVLAREYVRQLMDPDIIRQMSIALHDHGQTLVHNLNPKRREPPRLERIVSNDAVSVSARKAWASLAEREAQELLEKLDKWLSEQEVKEPEDKSRRLGLGIFIIDEENGP